MATEPGHTYSVTQNLVLGLQVIQNLICIISWRGTELGKNTFFIRDLAATDLAWLD